MVLYSRVPKALTLNSKPSTVSPYRTRKGTHRGAPKGHFKGILEGTLKGAPKGTLEGTLKGAPNGALKGTRRPKASAGQVTGEGEWSNGHKVRWVEATWLISCAAVRFRVLRFRALGFRVSDFGFRV